MHGQQNIKTCTVLYTLWTKQMNRSDHHKGRDARARACFYFLFFFLFFIFIFFIFYFLFFLDIWTRVLSRGQMCDFNCRTTYVEDIISIAYLIFISAF